MECEKEKCKDNSINWVKTLPSKPCPTSIYFLKTSNGVLMYVSSITGVLTQIGGSGQGGEVIITSPDSSITIVENGQNFEVSVSDILQILIQSALQPGNNVSELINDAGYLTEETLQDLQSVTNINPTTTNSIAVIGDLEKVITVSKLDGSNSASIELEENGLPRLQLKVGNSTYQLQTSNLTQNIVRSTSSQTGFEVVSVNGTQADSNGNINIATGIGFIPLSGTTTGNPVTGDIEFYNENDDTNSFIKYDGSLGNFFFGTEQSYIHPSGFYVNDGFDNSLTTGFSSGEFTLQSSNPNFKGLVGNVIFDKQNDPNAFAQLSDISDITGNFIPTSQKSQPNGVATLDNNGKVPLSQINDALIGSVNYQGNYNASTNTPALPLATGNKGKYYVVNVAGTQQGLTLTNGDWIISNGVIWEKVDSNNDVTSVAGKTGAVTLLTSDISGLDTTLNNKITNGGDANVGITIGSTNGYNVNIIGNNLNIMPPVNFNNAAYLTNASGFIANALNPGMFQLNGGDIDFRAPNITSDRPTSIPTFEFINANATSTGNILNFKNQTTVVASINKNGTITATNATADSHLVALGQLSNNIVSNATSLTLLATSRVMYYSYTGSASTTWTIPAVTGNTKLRLVLINTGTGNITLNTSGGTNDIWDSGTLTNTYPISPGSSMELFNNGNAYIIL